PERRRQRRTAHITCVALTSAASLSERVPSLVDVNLARAPSRVPVGTGGLKPVAGPARHFCGVHPARRVPQSGCVLVVCSPLHVTVSCSWRSDRTASLGVSWAWRILYVG